MKKKFNKHHCIKLIAIMLMAITQMTYAFLNSAPSNVYANTQAGMLSAEANKALPRVYVPNSDSGTVSVIDPSTYTVIDTFKTGKNPQHVVPAYDMKTLWVLNDLGNSLTPIDPTTAQSGPNVPVTDPYNLYFTPDGQNALVVAEKHRQLNFVDPHTMELRESIPVDCAGLNHMDFTTDGHYAIATCEFSGQLVKIDLINKQAVAYLTLGLPTSDAGPMPQDIRIAPDGHNFYVADMLNDGVFIIDPQTFQQTGFIATGIGTHSIYPSRDGKLFYVGNRGCHSSTRCKPHGPGSVSVLDPFKNQVIANWPIPDGGSPDMGNISADGKELWLSGRYDSEVYVFDTTTGTLTHRIAVGRSPHGLCVWPQPGRFSLGHTGNMR